MSSVFRPSAEELRKRSKASRLLARMEQLESLATQGEQEAVGLFRSEYAAKYRQIIGVHPSQRSELQEALRRIQAGGGIPVQDVLDVLSQRHSAKGDGEDGGWGTAAGADAR